MPNSALLALRTTMSLRPSIPIRANAKKPTFSIKSSLQHFSAMRSSSLVIGSSVYVLPPRRLRSAAAASSGASSTSLEFDWQENRCLHSKQRNGALPYWMQQQNSQYSRFAYDDLSEEDSDREMGSSQQLVSLQYAHFLWHVMGSMILSSCYA